MVPLVTIAKVIILSIGWNFFIFEVNWFGHNVLLPFAALPDSEEIYEVPIGSISCSTVGSQSGNRICHLKNLCYSNVFNSFLLASDDDDDDHHKLVRFENVVNFTTVVGSNSTFDYYLSSKTFTDMRHYRKLMFFGSYHLLGQFAPNNIAHDIHDFLLPLFNTLTGLNEFQLDTEPSRTLLIYGLVPITASTRSLYSLFSRYPPTLSLDVMMDESLVCFEDVTIGLSHDTIWYQWGFGQPEGPLDDRKVTSKHLQNFTGYVKEKLNIDDKSACLEKDEFGILFSRKSTRVILNEIKLRESISAQTGMTIRTLSFEQNSLEEIIANVSCAKFIVGMHGSILILGIFLPPNSVLLEMFPYALNANHYTHCRTWVEIKGMDLKYVSWRNRNRSNTVTHSFEGLYPGLTVTEEKRLEILASEEVAPHLCCADPAFRFRLNQDTIVDIPAVIEILLGALEEQGRRANVS
ncbi:protein O-linked-mannose beta-1,4-N-acetylglucosaminyltransferase 2-like [Apostichopus japonicus]|uniref:protein O-linked-mannose beta-1,4-N-acetylglucosaminyltransferase 2-like n=1 Tax=Stichopus japonicus TaxID=307972 RepID=UPI003AB1FFE1